MRPLDYAVNQITLHIPRQILEIAFIRRDISDDNTTIEDKIIRNVINRYIRPDLDMLGGPILNINVDQCEIKSVNNNTEYLIRVPKHLTDNLSIIRVLSLSSQYMYLMQREFRGGYNDSAPVALAGKMLNAIQPQTITNTANMELIGDNLISVHEPLSARQYRLLQVVIENKENFSNITPQYYKEFSELCIEATKMYIYTNKVVDFNLGYIQGGHEISVIKDIVEEYKDSFEKYQELLIQWKKIAVLNDQHRMNKLVKIVTGASI